MEYIIEDGYRAARRGERATANPYPTDVLGARLWAFGYDLGVQPWLVRVFVVMGVVGLRAVTRLGARLSVCWKAGAP